MLKYKPGYIRLTQTKYNMKKYLHIRLVKKGLAGSPNEYTAIPLTGTSLNLKEIIDVMRRRNPGLRRETIESCINLFQEVTSDLLTEGYRLNTGQLNLKPVVKGKCQGLWKNKKNCVRVSASPSAQMRRRMDEVEVKVFGILPESTSISTVTDHKTGLVNKVLSRNNIFFISGNRIKIHGSQPEVGIYLVHSGTKETYKIAPNEIVENMPGRLIVYLRDEIPEGAYLLKIITQYSTNKASKRLHEVWSKHILQIH